MKRLLFVTNRNALTTSGELRLIKNRAESLYSDYNIISDFFVFGSQSRIDSPKREVIKAGGYLTIVPISLSNLLSYYLKYGKVKKQLLETLKSKKYDAVVFSGPGMGVYSSDIKKFGIKVFFDVHGAVEDALQLAKSASTLNKIKFNVVYALEEHNLKNNLKHADGCFVVTKALEGYIRNRYKLSTNFSFHIVPCATKDDKNVVSNRHDCRLKYRQKYNISGDAKVFVYSGGISPWQCVKEAINLFKKIADQMNCDTKMLVFSHNIDAIKVMIGDDSRFIIDSYKPSQLKEALCAADYAFMLRKDCVTNNVAFPNKFLEYVESSLSIITTPFIYEVYSQVKKYSLGIIINDLSDSHTIIEFISNTESYSEEVARNVLQYNSFKNRLSSFAYAL
ncbi:glycosyltransferase, group 1 family protein [Bacteroides pyogenes F0041]|uniref:Glycosyltransferase, group 1 family protein n=1 Tax=Bacteroides pyogenes F0041 TaxID=1321819 RepID=U2CZ00_9BACE|nr:glycosyltransferase group 1 family protein [Bacteroides pyogenes]ERI89308.1 glycosyltransferase, group 1 family protein [Bacteroides pyogenes F0041]